MQASQSDHLAKYDFQLCLKPIDWHSWKQTG